MKNSVYVLLVATALTPVLTRAQQGPSSAVQPMPQAQSAPCVTVPPPSQKPQGGGIALKPPTKVQQYLDAQKKELARRYGIILPDTPSQLSLIPKSSTQPCLPQVGAVIPAPKLPPDATVTLHCNPMTPASKDTAHPTTLTLPDPHDFAVPKPSDFEADNVMPDLAAKTPCYLVKVNPKTQKPFVQQ